MQIVSIYTGEFHSKDGYPYDIELFFDDIRTGKHKDKVEEIRLLKYNFKLENERLKLLSDEEKKLDLKFTKAKDLLKQKKGAIPRVTISGKFGTTREAINLISHTGLIDIDIDKLENDYELKTLKQKLIRDKYCVACFVSCGGDGLSFICRIDSSKHNESWEGLKEYMFKNYGLSIDITHKSVANTRNASYDPEIYVRDLKPPVFKEYIKPKKLKEQKQQFVYTKTDFDDIIQEIVKRRIDFCPSNDYDTYRNIGFAIGTKFGADGLWYFKKCCENSETYNESNVERDYKYFCKEKSGGIKIGTFYARCKDFNIETSSKKTARIASVASAALKGGKNQTDTIANLVKFENFTKEECEEIVKQVFDDKIEFNEEKSILEDIETYLRHNYNLIKNNITGKLENNGEEWSEEDLNGLFVELKKVFDNADAKWIERIIFSPFIKSYNPIMKWFEDNKNLVPDELLDKNEIPTIIKKLWRSIETDNQSYLLKYGTKWLVSCIASAHKEVSNLELDLTGRLNKGKSYFFKYLLPVELRKYFAETTLEKEKDDEILMCMKWIILIDECGGKTRNDEKRHKRLLDKDIFSLRRPYRKDNEDIQRLAVLCGTSNPQNLLSDTHGNRRIIPVNVISRNFKDFDEIDKSELWMAAYYLYKNGFEWRIVEKEISELDQQTLGFNECSIECELLDKYYERANPGQGTLLTISDIKIFIEEKTNQKLSKDKLTNELRRLEYIQENLGRISRYRCLIKLPDLTPVQQAKAVDYF